MGGHAGDVESQELAVLVAQTLHLYHPNAFARVEAEGFNHLPFIGNPLMWRVGTIPNRLTGALISLLERYIVKSIIY